MNSPPNTPLLSNFWQKHWKPILGALLTIIGTCLTIVTAAAIICAKDWVQAQTEESLKTSLASASLADNVFKILDKNVVGSSYQSHFILNLKNLTEHYIPIYVADENEVKLFLDIGFIGTEKPISIQAYIDETPVPINFQKKQNFEVVLTSYIKKARESGIHEQDEGIYTLRFRIDPKEKSKTSASIKTLVNVYGFSRATKSNSGEAK